MHKLASLLFLVAAPAFAQPGPAPAPPAERPTPRSIGAWADWEAFAAREAAGAVCYALSRPFSSIPAVAGRDGPTLTVTRRPGRDDAVSLTAGRAGMEDAVVEMRVGSSLFAFDTVPDGAFARDGAAVATAMERGLQAVAHFTKPGGARATDTYSLRGFRAAYGAMRRDCLTPSDFERDSLQSSPRTRPEAHVAPGGTP